MRPRLEVRRMLSCKDVLWMGTGRSSSAACTVNAMTNPRDSRGKAALSLPLLPVIGSSPGQCPQRATLQRNRSSSRHPPTHPASEAARDDNPRRGNPLGMGRRTGGSQGDQNMCRDRQPSHRAAPVTAAPCPASEQQRSRLVILQLTTRRMLTNWMCTTWMQRQGAAVTAPL